MDILAERDCWSLGFSGVFSPGLRCTQVVLLPTGSAVFLLLTHYRPSLPSPYIFLEEAETITAFFFCPFYAISQPAPPPQDMIPFFLQLNQLTGTTANKLESHQSPEHSAGVSPIPHPPPPQKKMHVFIVPVIARSLKQTQTNPTIEGHGRTCYRNWRGGGGIFDLQMPLLPVLLGPHAWDAACAKVLPCFQAVCWSSLCPRPVIDFVLAWHGA